TGQDFLLRRTVTLFMNERPLYKFPALDHLLKSLGVNEVIGLPLDLARARRAGGVRHREMKVDADRLELTAGVVDQGRFARAGRSGDDEQGAVRMEVTRHSAPA